MLNSPINANDQLAVAPLSRSLGGRLEDVVMNSLRSHTKPNGQEYNLGYWWLHEVPSSGLNNPFKWTFTLGWHSHSKGKRHHRCNNADRITIANCQPFCVIKICATGTRANWPNEPKLVMPMASERFSGGAARATAPTASIYRHCQAHANARICPVRRFH